MKRISILVATAFLLLPMSTTAQEMYPGRVSVTGEGHVATAPDMVTVTLGAVAEAQEAGVAMDEMRRGIERILGHLEQAGVPSADIRTSRLSLDSRWDVPRAGQDVPGQRSFIATNMLTVRLREIGGLGQLLGTLGDSANNLESVTFGLQDPAPAEDAAREAALRDAMHRAELYARTAGVKLGPILSIDETGGVQPYMMRAEAMKFAADGGMPVAPGEVEFSASVSVTYALGEPVKAAQ